MSELAKAAKLIIISQIGKWQEGVWPDEAIAA